MGSLARLAALPSGPQPGRDRLRTARPGARRTQAGARGDRRHHYEAGLTELMWKSATRIGGIWARLK
jgi:hypothetical protein